MTACDREPKPLCSGPHRAVGRLRFAVVLAFHNITDGDLVGQIGHRLLALEHRASAIGMTSYAFTPTLPKYIDHEWGAGVVFYALLQWFGPSSLVVLRMVLAAGLLALGFLTGRGKGAMPISSCCWPFRPRLAF
jgi:hypothetical protein